ncbi:MAG: hypothetical protein ACOYJY_03180 [Acutalibacteraceae bacterium]
MSDQVRFAPHLPEVAALTWNTSTDDAASTSASSTAAIRLPFFIPILSF